MIAQAVLYRENDDQIPLKVSSKLVRARALVATSLDVSYRFDTPQPKGVEILASTGESRKHGTKSRYFPRSLYPQRAFFGTARSYLLISISQGLQKAKI